MWLQRAVAVMNAKAEAEDRREEYRREREELAALNGDD
jgi:hypothetical protein